MSEPEPKADEVLIKIKACGVCRSNLHMIEGDWVHLGVPSKSPIIPGHEVVGVVDKLGKDVTNLSIGDRVGIQPLFKTCEHCEYCLNGRENLCPDREITGETVDGGYAEYMVAPSSFVSKVPDNVPDLQAAPLFCPGITAYKAVKNADIEQGKRIAIFGIGGVGNLAIQFAKIAGAEVLAIVSSNNVHAKLAREVGADEVIVYDKDRMKEKSLAVDSAIVFAPSQTMIDAGFKMIKPGGTLVVGVFGGVRDLFFPDEKVVKGSVIGTREDMGKVLSIASEGKLKILTEEFPLERASEALKKLKNNEIYGRAVLTV